MKTELLTKQKDFLPVAQHGALLFSVMCELQKLHPYYRFPLEAFMQLFHDTVAERNRGKKSSGSPAARAAELVTALSRKIVERTSWSLFQSKLDCHRLGKKIFNVRKFYFESGKIDDLKKIQVNLKKKKIITRLNDATMKAVGTP